MLQAVMIGRLKLLAPIMLAGLVCGCGGSLGTNGEIATAKLGTQEQSIGSEADGQTSAIVDTKSRRSARKAAKKLTSINKPGSSAYKIGPQDVLSISVFKVADLSKTVQVSDAGTVNLPLVGEVVSAGRTSREVEQDLTKKWGSKYLQNPQVTVLVKEYNSQRITIEGAVKKPGVYPIRGQMTLLQAIATVGGFSATSDSTVLVFREQNGKRKAAKFNIADIRSGGARDPKLVAGDVVVAGKSAFKEGLGNVLKVLPLAGAFAIL